MTQTIHFNDVDLSAYELTLLRAPGVAGASPRASDLDLGRVDGTTATNHAYGPKVISCRCLVKGTSWSDLQDNIDAILGALNERQDRDLWLDTWSDRYWNARLDGAPDIAFRGGTVAEVEIEFIARDPFAYARSGSSSGPTSITGDGDALSLVTGGSEWAYPVYVLEANATITATIVLENETLDLRLAWTTNMTSGGLLRITTDPRTQLIEHDAGGVTGYEPSMSGFSGNFPPLRHSVTEAIKVYGFRGTITTTWENRFI